ncbi:MAG: aspartate/glutamate racemase family protein [Acutalibacter sp.]|jgi:aspartate racemase
MKTLGIIGGMGPMATAYLLELIIQMTDAKTDQEHLSVIVLNNPQVPDRTAYILDNSKPSPLPVLEDMAHTLESVGAGVLCAPCVTSHYFYEELAGNVQVPFVHMVKETAQELRIAGKHKAGILATTGTVRTGLFQQALENKGLSWAVPSETGQKLVMSLIYDDIKAGKPADMGKFRRVSDELFDAGCDSIILGCTELSLVKKDTPLGRGYLDALEVLSKRCVETCGGPLKAQYNRLIS